MVDETDVLNEVFSDGDLADPENLPEKTRFLGQVTDVDMSNAKPGNYRKFNNPLKDGRTEVPMISLKLRAVMNADGTPFSADRNYMAQTSCEFWVGPQDTIGRHSLAGLVEKCRGYSKEEMKGKSLGSAVAELKGAYVTFEVVWQEGDQATFQKARKLKAATNEEIALIG